MPHSFYLSIVLLTFLVSTQNRGFYYYCIYVFYLFALNLCAQMSVCLCGGWQRRREREVENKSAHVDVLMWLKTLGVCAITTHFFFYSEAGFLTQTVVKQQPARTNNLLVSTIHGGLGYRQISTPGFPE